MSSVPRHDTPALFTRIVTGPNSFSVRATIASTAEGSATSAIAEMARPRPPQSHRPTCPPRQHVRHSLRILPRRVVPAVAPLLGRCLEHRLSRVLLGRATQSCSSVSAFVQPAHSSSEFNIASNPSGGASTQHVAGDPLSRMLNSRLKSWQPREPTCKSMQALSSLQMLDPVS